MDKKKIKTTLLALGTTAMATFGLAACNTGTEPGETNVERGEVHEEGDMIGDEPGNTTRYSDTANLEKHYEHADHEGHTEGDEGGAVHAGDGTGEGTERDDVQ